MAKTYPVSSPGDKSASIRSNGGGGGKVKPVGSGTEGDGSFDGSDELKTMVPDGASELSALGTSREAEQEISREEDASELWNSVVEEASSIKGLKIDHNARFRRRFPESSARQLHLPPPSSTIKSSSYSKDDEKKGGILNNLLANLVAPLSPRASADTTTSNSEEKDRRRGPFKEAAPLPTRGLEEKATAKKEVSGGIGTWKRRC
ncbi:hypothetical protein LINPERHAP1_LOCUS24501 [Linum perenne]